MENVYDVPKRQWKKWSPLAKAVFNDVYYTLVGNQELFLHPHAAIQRKEMWDTTCWNAAWIAADAVKDNE